jgi:uncharacterized protein YdcH (DUF465 family)
LPGDGLNPAPQQAYALTTAFAAHAEEELPMHVLPHDLDHEFPEFSPLINDLKQHDDRAAHLFDEYERVNRAIVDIEENDKPFQDFEFEEMKKRRLLLKDSIYLMLRERAFGSA